MVKKKKIKTFVADGLVQGHRKDILEINEIREFLNCCGTLGIWNLQFLENFNFFQSWNLLEFLRILKFWKSPNSQFQRILNFLRIPHTSNALKPVVRNLRDSKFHELLEFFEFWNSKFLKFQILQIPNSWNPEFGNSKFQIPGIPNSKFQEFSENSKFQEFQIFENSKFWNSTPQQLALLHNTTVNWHYTIPAVTHDTCHKAAQALPQSTAPQYLHPKRQALTRTSPPRPHWHCVPGPFLRSFQPAAIKPKHPAHLPRSFLVSQTATALLQDYNPTM